MKTFHEESMLSIQQQIARLEQDYVKALELDQEFETLKNIRLRINFLESTFVDLVQKGVSASQDKRRPA